VSLNHPHRGRTREQHKRQRNSSFYISYRGFYAATRPPGASRDPGSPSQALWVGEDRTCPPCPRSGRSAPRTLAHRAPWGARKRRRSGSANDTRLAPPACSTAPERPRMGTGPAQRQPYGLGGHVPRMQASNPPAGGSMARPPKWDSRVPATLVPDGAAPRTQESHPSTLGGLGAHIERLDSRGPLDATPCDPTATMRDPSTATTRAPSVSGVIGWVLAARGAPPNAGARTSGRWPKHVRWTTPPWAPTATTGGPSTATTRAPSVSGMTGWVLAARRASRSAGARTGSICAGVALRRVRTVRRTRGPWRPLEPRHVPDAHAGRGREEHGVYGYRPRP